MTNVSIRYEVHSYFNISISQTGKFSLLQFLCVAVLSTKMRNINLLIHFQTVWHKYHEALPVENIPVGNRNTIILNL